VAHVQAAPDEGAAKELYEQDQANLGYVPNYTKLFAWRPEVYRAWQQLNGAIKQDMDLRRYELATLAAARELRSSYCALAHGKVLRDKFLPAEQVRDAAIDHHRAGLEPLDVAVMDFAEKVTRSPASVTSEDVKPLRQAGFSDQDILDVTLAVAARCFFSTVLEALGAEPDPAYHDVLEPDLREALTVGRPIAEV
jgi:uncharacterized peroxidase-related enzyme